jgi:hypothetical protein
MERNKKLCEFLVSSFLFSCPIRLPCPPGGRSDGHDSTNSFGFVFWNFGGCFAGLVECDGRDYLRCVWHVFLFFSFVTQAPHQQDPVQGPVLHAARPWQERESFLDTHSQFIVYSLRLLPFLFSHQLLFSLLLLLLLVKITKNLSHTGGWMRIMLQRRFIAKRPIFGYIGRLGSL